MRTALVTGGSGAVGGAVVRALAARDVRVVCTYNRAENTAKAIEAETGAKALAIDLSDATKVDAFAREVAETHAPDIFVHAAGVMRWTSLEEGDAALFDHVMSVNVRSGYLIARALAAKGCLKDAVFTSALDRGQSMKLPPAFAASQGAITAMSMALAKELGPRGVRVNAVALGLLEKGASQREGGVPPALASDFTTFSALRRKGTPDEVARVIAWLAYENDFLTGKTIPANGGL